MAAGWLCGGTALDGIGESDYVQWDQDAPGDAIGGQVMALLGGAITGANTVQCKMGVLR